MINNTDIIIIGAGPVGLFSVFQAGMLGMRCHVIDALDFAGGQCQALYPEKPIYDIPAYPKVLASELVSKLQEQAAPFLPVYHLGQQAVDLKKNIKNNKVVYQITTNKGITIEAKAVVIAAGCGAFGPNKPPLEGIDKFEGKSVLYYVTNINHFKDKNIVIAGGGDSAIDWAINLSKVAKKIFLVHRRDKFRAAAESVRQVHEIVKNGNIELVIGYQLYSIHGDEKLQAIEVKDLSGKSRVLNTDYLLPFFGLAQEIGPIGNWGIELKANYVKVDNTYFQTNIDNIYAVGDIATYPGKLKLILTGFAEAASVMHHAYNRVFEGKALHFEYSTTKGINS